MSFSHRILAIFLLTSLSVACGGGAAANSGSDTAVATRSAVATPKLPGTPVTVCPRLAKDGLVASSYAVEGGFALQLGTLDEDFAEKLRTDAGSYVERQRALEAGFQNVVAEQLDDGDGVYVRFSHDDQALIDEVGDILEEGVRKRPAAARRVSFRRGDGFVEMQLPNGGPLITSKTKDAAREAVGKWTDREPTGLDFEGTDSGFKLEIRSSDSDRLDELRSDAIDTVFRCPEQD